MSDAVANPNPKKRARRSATASPPKELISSAASAETATSAPQEAATSSESSPIIISGVEGPKSFLINGIYDPHLTIKSLYSCRADANRWIEYNSSKKVWMVVPTTCRGTTRCWAYFAPTSSAPPPAPPSSDGTWYVVSPDAKSYVPQRSVKVERVTDLFIVSLCRDTEGDALVGVYDSWDRAIGNARTTFHKYWSESNPVEEWRMNQVDKFYDEEEDEFNTDIPYIVDNSESAELSRAGGIVYTVGGEVSENVSVTVKRMELNMDITSKKPEKSEVFKSLY